MSELIDNRAHRIRTLRDVITRLHAGESPAAVKSLLASVVRECDASEIAAMEQELMGGGMPVTEVMRMCDLHSEVLRDIVVERPRTVAPGHPVDTFSRENAALREACAKMRATVALAAAGARADDGVDGGRRQAAREVFNQLMDVEKHYRRKEHLLFPILERYGITGPSKVMWGKDDEVRAILEDLGAALAEDEVSVAEWKLIDDVLVRPALGALEEMTAKEEKILLPLALDTLSERDWGEIWSQSPEFGWCLVEPRDGWRPPTVVTSASEAAVAAAERAGVVFEAASATGESAGADTARRGALVFPTGSLSLDQLTAIFSTLPVDLTFVDADDRVRFFTEGPSRVFQRPRTIVGRKVQHCHPPSSVDVVERILSDFRGNRQSVAEFWIQLRGRFVHIRYFAVRDDGGAYLGTLEVTQDLTRERALDGERRLLQYDPADPISTSQ